MGLQDNIPSEGRRRSRSLNSEITPATIIWDSSTVENHCHISSISRHEFSPFSPYESVGGTSFNQRATSPPFPPPSSTTAASPYRSLPSTPFVLDPNSLSSCIESQSLPPPSNRSDASSPTGARHIGIPFPVCANDPNDYHNYHHFMSDPFLHGYAPTSTPGLSHSTILTNNHNEDEQDDQPPAPQLVWSIVFIGFLNIFVDTALSSSVIPILPKELGLDEFHEGIILAVGATTASMFGPVCGWLSDDCGWQLILVWFYPLVIGSSVLMMSAKKSFIKFVIARLVAGMGSGFMYPANLSMVVATHDPALRSSAVGFTLAGDIGSLAGPLLGGYLYDIGGSSLVFSVLIALSIFATLVFFISLPSSTNSQSVISSDISLPLLFPSTSSLPSHIPNQPQQLFPYQSSRAPSHNQSAPAPPQIHYPPSARTLSVKSPSSRQSDFINRSSNDLPSCGHGGSTEQKSTSPKRTSIARNPFTHGSPPPPYVYNLHIRGTAKIEERRRLGIVGTLQMRLDELNVFASIPFLSRCAALFYCWGIALSLQAILPIIWNNKWGVSPSSIGLLFAPHLILRVSFSAFFPFFSDITSTPLRTLISLGLLVCTLSITILACLPMSSPTTHSIVVGFVGMGLGLTDSCVTAWAGSVEFQLPSTENTNKTTTSTSHCDTSEAYRGRAFALLALACDTGMFVLPLITALLSEYLAFSLAFGVLGFCGVLVLGLSLYSGWIEAQNI